MAYLWLIDSHGCLPREEIAQAVVAAEAAGMVLYRRMLLREHERGREEAMLRDLVSADTAARARAKDEIADRGLMTVSGQTALASVDVVWPQEGSPSADAQAPLSAAVEEACRVEPAGRTLVQVRPRRALVLYAAAASANAVQQSLATLAGRALRTLEATTDSACRAVAGVGSVEAGLDGCPISYRHARGAGAPAMRVRVPRGCAAGHMAARRAASWLACTGGG